MSAQSSAIVLIILSIFGVVNTASYGYRIVNGSNGEIRDYPYLASITFFDDHICGGTILNANTILTATHCLISKSPNYYEVRLGSSFHRGGQKIKIAKVVSYEQYDNVTHVNDIGLLKLEKKIKFGKDVAMAKLPQPNSDVSANVKGVIVGWGSLRYNGQDPQQLQHAEVPVVDRCVCKDYYKQDGLVTERHICAGKTGVSACQGDSGGPLIVNGETVGIVSWAKDDCCECGPTVFTRVSCFIDWIKQHL